jgi:hypothetical protein
VWNLRQGSRETKILFSRRDGTLALGSTHRFTIASSTSTIWCPRSLLHMRVSRSTIWSKVNRPVQGQPRSQVDPFYSHVTTNTLFSARRRSAGNIEDTPSWMLFFVSFFPDYLEYEAYYYYYYYYYYALCSLTCLPSRYRSYGSISYVQGGCIPLLIFVSPKTRTVVYSVENMSQNMCNNLCELLVSGQGKDRQCTIRLH